MKRLALFVVLSALAACKSGIGSRCQTDSDCNSSALTCNATMGICEMSGGQNPIDAEPPDVGIDAATDAVTDVATDVAVD